MQSTLRNHLYKYQKHGTVPFPEQKLSNLIKAGEFSIQTSSSSDEQWPANEADKDSTTLSNELRRSQRSKKVSKSASQAAYISSYDTLFDNEEEPAIISINNTTIYDMPEIDGKQGTEQINISSPTGSVETADTCYTKNSEGKRAKEFNPDDYVNKVQNKDILIAKRKSVVKSVSNKHENTTKEVVEKSVETITPKRSSVLSALRQRLLSKNCKEAQESTVPSLNNMKQTVSSSIPSTSVHIEDPTNNASDAISPSKNFYAAQTLLAVIKQHQQGRLK